MLDLKNFKVDREEVESLMAFAIQNGIRPTKTLLPACIYLQGIFEYKHYTLSNMREAYGSDISAVSILQNRILKLLENL